MVPRRFERFPLCVRTRWPTRRTRWRASGRTRISCPKFLRQDRQPFRDKEHVMLYYAIVFLIIAIIAGFFGFFGVAGLAASIAKILFVIFIILFILSLIFGRRRVP
jgi:uncharacterized membrane protein YtjA (UPF0391 family)